MGELGSIMERPHFPKCNYLFGRINTGLYLFVNKPLRKKIRRLALVFYTPNLMQYDEHKFHISFVRF